MSEAAASFQHFNVEAEQQLIGRILTDETALAEALAHCSADDFSYGPHRQIVATAQELRDQGMVPSALTVKARLGACPKLDSIGGISYLKSICAAASLQHVPADLAKIVADLALRRRIDEQFEAGRERLSAHDQPIHACVGDAAAAINEALDRRMRGRGYLALPEAVDGVLRTAEAAFNGQRPPAIRTGLNRLDDIVGGFHGGDLVIAAGRPGMGKTIALSGVCKAAALAGAPAILIELEMPRDQIVQRLICDIDYDDHADDPLPYTRFRNGKLSSGQFGRAIDAGMRLKRLPLEIFDSAGASIHEIAAIAERFAQKQKRMGIIAIDYLQIVQPSDRYKGSKVQEVTEISNAAKALAKRLNWPVILGCQLNRGVEARDVKRPRLGDLRESGAIEQDADIVLGLFRKGYYVEESRPEHGPNDPKWREWLTEFQAVKNDLDIIILKNRNGATGTVPVHVEVTASALRNRAEDCVAYPEGYAG